MPHTPQRPSRMSSLRWQEMGYVRGFLTKDKSPYPSPYPYCAGWCYWCVWHWAVRLVLWFVSTTGAINKQFIKFLPCKDGVYDEVLSALYISSRQEHGLDVNLLCGQGYERPGAITGPSMAWLLESRSNLSSGTLCPLLFDRGNRGSAVWSHKGHFYFALVVPYMEPDGTVSVAKFVGPGVISRYYGGHLLHLCAETTQGVA